MHKLLQKEPSHHRFEKKATSEASASSKEDDQEEVPSVPLGKPDSRHTAPLGFCYSWV